MKFCSNCGAALRVAIPPGDHKPRGICDSCGSVHYENPRMIAGCVPVWEEKVLLCKRANEPRKGFWTLPAGFLENDETVEAGAARETLEEANARVRDLRPFSLYSIPAIGQIYLFFVAELSDLNFAPGAESEQVALFAEHEVPWNELAFTSVEFTLRRYFTHSQSLNGAMHVGSSLRTSHEEH